MPSHTHSLLQNCLQLLHTSCEDAVVLMGLHDMHHHL
jgi:hypothetical protein